MHRHGKRLRWKQRNPQKCNQGHSSLRPGTAAPYGHFPLLELEDFLGAARATRSG